MAGGPAGRAAAGARRLHPAGASGRDRVPKKAVYAILFRTVAETLRRIAADPKHLGAEIGLVAVLDTWGQNLHLHPHVHCVVPGGGPSLDGTRWVACRPGFFTASRGPSLAPVGASSGGLGAKFSAP
jgi:Putative transposase